MNLIREIWQSIVRRDPLTTDKGKSELVFLNVWLHIHPAKVKKENLKFRHTFYLGFITFFLFLILLTTGIALMVYYRPYPPQAYQDMKDLQFAVFMGPFLRNMHRWAAHGMVVCVFLHMCRVFYTGSYKKPRQFNWVVGVVLLLLTLGISFTGYLLPWDQLAFWAITVGSNIGSYAPIVGGQLRELLLGGHSVGEAALLRFYVLHVAVLPSAMILLTIVHFWRVRKDGGLSRPDEPGDVVQQVELKQLPTNKTYGLMELARGTTPQVGKNPEEEVFSWPHLVFREILLFLLVTAVVLFLAIFWNAPLEEYANPIHPPNPAKAPWYFLGLQEFVSYSAFWGGVVIPGLLVTALTNS